MELKKEYIHYLGKRNYSSHARVRMFERDISSEDIMPILTDGEVIEYYVDDTPAHHTSSLDIRIFLKNII